MPQTIEKTTIFEAWTAQTLIKTTVWEARLPQTIVKTMIFEAWTAQNVVKTMFSIDFHRYAPDSFYTVFFYGFLLVFFTVKKK